MGLRRRGACERRKRGENQARGRGSKKPKHNPEPGIQVRTFKWTQQENEVERGIVGKSGDAKTEKQ